MKKILPLIFLGLLASILIFYKYNLIPKNLAFDEVEFAKLALSLRNKPYLPYSTLATGHSTLYFYIILFSFNIFGVTSFALRFPSAIFGILSVLIFYLIMKRVFQSAFTKASADKQYFPFLLSFILLSSHWFLNFTRFSFEATFLLFLELTSILFLIKAQMPVLSKSPGAPLGYGGRTNTASSFYLIMTGAFSGLAFLSYTPGRIFFLLPLFFLILETLRTLKLYKLIYFLIPFLIIITPLTSYLLTNKDTRIDQQFFLKNHEMTINEKARGLWSNVSSTTLMFFTKGDMNGRHNYPGKPALNPILGALFIIGFVSAIKSAFVKTTADKQWNNRLFLFYFLLSIFPALMTYPWENPNMLRTYTVLPSVIFFIGIATVQLINRLYINKKLIALLIMVLLLSSIYELRTYFKYQSIVFNKSFEIKLPLDKAIKVKLKP